MDLRVSSRSRPIVRLERIARVRLGVPKPPVGVIARPEFARRRSGVDRLRGQVADHKRERIIAPLWRRRNASKWA